MRLPDLSWVDDLAEAVWGGIALLLLAVLAVGAYIVVAGLLKVIEAHAAESVVASIYWPGDGVVPHNDYDTSSGQRYDADAMRCAAPPDTFPLGTRLYLRHGRNTAEVVVNDRGPFIKGRKLDCTPAVDKTLHLGGLGYVRVERWPPLPMPRPK